MIDATIEMVDGVMVVSPKEVKFEPKDGDVIVVQASFNYIAIYKKVDTGIGRYACFCTASRKLYTEENNILCTEYSVVKIRPATEEEKKLLFDKLAEEGLEWDAERKELVKLKWKPEEGFEFWHPLFGGNSFVPFGSIFNRGRDKIFLDKGWCFKNQQECQEFCNRLNEAINQVKP